MISIGGQNYFALRKSVNVELVGCRGKTARDPILYLSNGCLILRIIWGLNAFDAWYNKVRIQN